MRRDFRQVGFAEALVNQRAARNGWMDELDQLIDWSRVEGLLGDIFASREGRASYPILTYVKLLLLQAWYGLTDEGLEEAVDDRLSFRRFAGIPLDESVPDHSAIWRFRQTLQEGGRLAAVFAEIGEQLAARGLVVKQGTLVDATLIEAAARRPQPAEGEVSSVDPQASLVRRRDGRRTFFGYKAHVAVDEGSGLIRAVEVTGADVHDSLVLGGAHHRRRGAGYGGQGLLHPGEPAVPEGDGGRRLHPEEGAQVPPARAVGKAAQRHLVGAALGGGAGVRDAEASLSVGAAALLRARPQHCGADARLPGDEPEAGAGAAAGGVCPEPSLRARTAPRGHQYQRGPDQGSWTPPEKKTRQLGARLRKGLSIFRNIFIKNVKIR
jgi:IS5 family transposase